MKMPNKQVSDLMFYSKTWLNTFFKKEIHTTKFQKCHKIRLVSIICLSFIFQAYSFEQNFVVNRCTMSSIKSFRAKIQDDSSDTGYSLSNQHILSPIMNQPKI